MFLLKNYMLLKLLLILSTDQLRFMQPMWCSYHRVVINCKMSPSSQFDQSFSERREENAMYTGCGFFLGYHQYVVNFYETCLFFLGHYCPRNTKFATQYPCPPGTYSEALNIWDASKCQLCPPGRVCSKPGLARPDGLCMPGWFCPPGSTSSKPVFPGNYSGTKGNDKA